MADETPLPPPPPPPPPRTYRLTHQDAIEFLAQKEKVSVCPCCGENNWQLFIEFQTSPSQPYDLASVGVGPNGEFMISPPSLPMIAVICNNCAYMRFHAKRLIEHWVVNRNATRG